MYSSCRSCSAPARPSGMGRGRRDAAVAQTTRRARLCVGGAAGSAPGPPLPTAPCFGRGNVARRGRTSGGVLWELPGAQLRTILGGRLAVAGELPERRRQGRLEIRSSVGAQVSESVEDLRPAREFYFEGPWPARGTQRRPRSTNFESGAPILVRIRALSPDVGAILRAMSRDFWPLPIDPPR